MTTEAKKKAPARADFMKSLIAGTAATGGKPAETTAPAPAAAAPVEQGGIFVWGKQLVIEDKQGNESKILLRFPTSMLEKLDGLTTNTRTAAIVAIVADAIMRAEKGEKLNFNTDDYAHFFKKA